MSTNIKFLSIFLVKFFGASLGFLFAFLVSHKLGPNEFGNYTFFMSFSLFSAFVFFYGIDINILKNITNNGKFSGGFQTLLSTIFFTILLILSLALLAIGIYDFHNLFFY